ncbi:hypothetical protein [Campylobacter sp. VTCC 70190]|uniref:hypothetical protein n=1 Tax=Campylobacter sp. VTCC 70190 TaxID=3392118 RepID=UPI00398E7B99
MAKTSKKEQLRFKAIEAYKTRNISNFSLESWILWVDYKLEKEKEPTMTTFNHNLNQLISFRDKAEQSLDNSISSGWRGLFAVKEKKAYGKKGKVLSKEQKIVSDNTQKIEIIRSEIKCN